MTRGLFAILAGSLLVIPATAEDLPARPFSDADADTERKFATPQATWLKAVKAVRKRDWKTFSACLTQEAHSDLTFELLAILAVTDAVNRAAVNGELTENSHEPFEERLEANLVAMCSRWIPAARLEAGEPLGRRPEEHSLHDVDDLRIINRQRELFFRGLDPKRKMDEHKKARRDFVRGFANRSQMMGTLAELISFSSPDHQFPIPVSAAVQGFEATDSQAEAQLPGKAGMVGGTVQFQRLDSGQWRISSLWLLDAGQLLAQIRQHLKSLQDKPAVSSTK